MKVLHSKRFVVLFLMIGVVLISGLCCGLSWNEMRIRKTDISDAQIVSPEEGAWVNMDEASVQANAFGKNRLVVAGWAVIKGHTTKPVAIKIVLMNEETGEAYRLPTSIIARPDVTAYFNDGVNYDYSGFSVNTRCKGIDLINKKYSVLVLYELGDSKYLLESNGISVGI